ncbi:MAG TPA: hypothetical protein P5084_04325 [Paludibacter sp.]|nr:hypothetical protein [Paludibacter sp.]
MKIKITLFFIAVCAFWGVQAQSVKINNNLTIESDGTIVTDGAATTWDDLMVYPDATTRSGSNPPTWSGKFAGNGTSQGVYLWIFDKSQEQEVYFTIQIPHSYKLGTTLKPHVHWTTLAITPSNNVVWGLEYTIMKIGGTFSSTSTILTSNTIISTITPTGTKQHLITSLGDIVSGTAPNDIDISTVLVCRLFRKAADGLDTFDDPAGLLGFDIHFEKNTDGSRNEYQK